MTDTIKEINNTEESKEAVVASWCEGLEKADKAGEFFCKNHIHDGLTLFSSDGKNVVVPVISADGKVLKGVEIDAEGNVLPREHLEKDEALLVGRTKPEYLMHDLVSACITYKITSKSVAVYRDAENLTVFSTSFSEAKIVVGFGDDEEKSLFGDCIDVNKYDSKANKRLFRRDYANVAEFYFCGGDIFNLLKIKHPKYRINQLGWSLAGWKPRSWIIESWLPASPSIAMLFGPSGTGKTYIIHSLFFALATGTDWFGLKTKKSVVLYLCGEGQETVMSRMMCLIQQNGYAGREFDIPYYVQGNTFDFNNEEQLAEFESSLENYFHEYKPNVIAIDTLNLFMSGDENDTESATLYMQALKRFTAEYDCSVILVHHTGASTESRARGSTVFKGAIDVEWRLKSCGNGLIMLEQTKNRYGATAEELFFKLSRYPLDGVCYESGEQVYDSVLERADCNMSSDAKDEARDNEFLISVCLAKNEKGSDWKEVTRRELIEYGSELLDTSKTPIVTQMNPAQKGRILYKLIDSGALIEIEGGKYPTYCVGESIVREVEEIIKAELNATK